MSDAAEDAETRPRTLLRRVRTPAAVVGIADAISHPEEWALVLDFDGTVAPFVKRPERARLGRVVSSHLRRLPLAFGAVAFISGRPADFLHAAVGSDAITFVGLYGAEERLPHSASSTLGAEFAPYVEPLHRFLAAHWSTMLTSAGITLEDKGAIATLHWRGAADPAAAERALASIVADAAAAGWLVVDNEMNVEIRPPIPLSKEDATAHFLGGRDWRGVILIGDETSDMRAWDAAERLHAEGRIGRVVRVGVASDHVPEGMRQTADMMVPGVSGVSRLLSRLAQAQPQVPSFE